MATTKRDNIYLNVVIQPNAANGVNNTIAKYDETLTNPVLMCPQDYSMSVIRFSLPIDQIPLFSFPMDVNNINPNVSYCEIGLRVAGVNYMYPLVYIPRNTLPIPTSTASSAPYFTNEQSISPYFNMFSINHMISMINTAVAAAYTISGLVGNPPYYMWDASSELITLYIPNSMMVAGHQVVVNKYMKDYLAAFEYFQDNNTINAPLFYNINNPKNLDVAGYHLHVQEYVAIALWMDLRKIIIVSRTLPICSEVLPDQITTQSAQLPQFSGISSTLPVVSDFVLSYDQFNQISSVIVYNPISQYRWVDLVGNTPINKIDLQFFYMDRFGNKLPIYISPTNEISIKIAFVRKDFNGM